MAHFAKLDENNIVTFVTVGRDEDNELELTERTSDTYKQTSYNTHGGIYYQADNTPSPNQSKAFRKNFAGIGYTYDKNRDAFIPPQPYPSWVLNEQTCTWNSPIPYPNDGSIYLWNEGTQVWNKVR